jgi:hypothetical protein
MQVTADWKVVRTTIPSLSCSGRATGQLAQFSVRVDAGPVVNSDRTLKVSVFDIDIHAEEIHLEFTKGTCSLWTSVLHQMIENELKYTLNHKMGDIMEVRPIINDYNRLDVTNFSCMQPVANMILSQFNTPSNIVIPGIAKLWIPIASTPKITSDSMWVTLQAEFSPLSSSSRYSGSKLALADAPKPAQKQLQVLSNSLVFNSFAWSLFTDGLMSYSVQDSILAISVTLSIRATAAPTIQIVASDVANRFRVDATVPVEITASRKSIGLTVNCQIVAPLAIGIEGQKFVGSIEGDVEISNVKFSVTNTSIGLSLSYVEGWLNGIVNKYVVPRAETLMGQGVPFPPLKNLGFALSTPQMTSSTSTIFTSTNFIPVSPSAMEKELDRIWLEEELETKN